ncbi:MAG: hypothetical protein ACRDH8_05275 [Actinomycetota bacterium]
MYQRVMAQERIGDRVREAEAYHLARQTRRSRAGQRQGTMTRIKSAIVSVVLWPARH